MTPADLIVVMLFHGIQQASKKNDRQSLMLVLGIMHHVVTELPGDNSALLRYVEQCIAQFGGLKNL